MRRIFVPLKRKYFELIKQGNKIVELRSESSLVVKQYVKAKDGRALFRCGYRGESLLGSLNLLWVGKRDELPNVALRYARVTRDEAQKLFKADEKVWAFSITLHEAPSR